MRITVLIIFMCYGITAMSQQDTNYTPTRKGPLKSWRLAGISLSTGQFSNKNSADLISVFKSMATDPSAKTKFEGDENNINSYQRRGFDIRHHYRANAALRFTLKPRIISWQRFASFTELSAAITYSNVSGLVWMNGESNRGDTFDHYFTSNHFSYDNIGLDLGYSIQTPGFFSYFALYTGPRVYATLPFNSMAYSGASKQYSHSHNRYPEITYYEKDAFVDNSNFSRPVFNAGLSVPIGIKLNIFPRWNLFFEYIFNYHVTYYSNSYQSAIWYKGMELGIRYRFIQKEKDTEEKRKGPAPAPEPFY